MKIVLGLLLPLGCLAAPFATFPDGCVTPDGMAVDAQDRLVIAAANFADTKKPGALFRIDNPGDAPYKWLDLPVNPATGRCSPMGIAYGDDGALYVVDNQPWTGEALTKNQGRLLRLEIKDDKLSAWHVVAEGMEHPNGVKFHKGKLYLTQSSLSPIKDASGLLVSGVYRFDPSDRNVKVANAKSDKNLILTVTTKNKFCQYGLDGLAFDAEGRLYVGNFGDGEVSRVVFDAKGTVVSLATFAKSPFDITRDPAKPGFLKHAMSCPMRTTDGMCFGPDGWLYVADFSNNAIAKVSPDGARVEFVRRDEDGKWLEGLMNQPGEPIFWRGRLIASNFDAVAGTPDKTNAKTESPATLSEILPAPVTSWTNPLVKPTGAWKAWCDTGAWPYAWVSEKAGDAVEVEFEGTSFSVCHRRGACRWIGGMTFRDQTSPLGFFEAFVDGKSVGTFDSSLREETCVAKGLASGRHVARIVNLGRSSRTGGPGRIALRAFRADLPPRLPTPDPWRESPELAAEAKVLPPILFFTGSPLRSGAIPNYVWQTNPAGPWGCSIRSFDPATGKTQVLFEEKDSIILDMSLSPDTSTHGASSAHRYAAGAQREPGLSPRWAHRVSLHACAAHAHGLPAGSVHARARDGRRRRQRARSQLEHARRPLPLRPLRRAPSLHALGVRGLELDLPPFALDAVSRRAADVALVRQSHRRSCGVHPGARDSGQLRIGCLHFRTPPPLAVRRNRHRFEPGGAGRRRRAVHALAHAGDTVRVRPPVRLGLVLACAGEAGTVPRRRSSRGPRRRRSRRSTCRRR